MPFVKRAAHGDIIAVSRECTNECQEEVASNDEELVIFLSSMDRSQLTQSDLDFVRVVEDLVDVLVAKNYLLFTDLPEKAQDKMRNRKTLRGKLNSHLDLLGDEEKGFF